MQHLTVKDRILGGLWGAVVGDALGVPVEFKPRATVQANPVTGMRGHGTHNQPPGTWSDDSSLLLCTADSLLQHEFDTEDMGKKFVGWYREELWTPHGKVFDIGNTTAHALARIQRGVRAEVAGDDTQYSNGNGSLMRILPVAIRFTGSPTKELLDRMHRASAITHRHPRSEMACGLYALVIRELLRGRLPHDAFAQEVTAFREFYEADPWWAVELEHFQLLLTKDFALRPGSDIGSGGYVMETLAASLWCLLTTNAFSECVLKAVNLGEDTDTTSCVAGGLAGVHYGLASIPQEWRCALADHVKLETLFSQFAELVSSKLQSP